MTRPCEVPNCPRPHWGRGWCRPHYLRWRRTGNVRPDTPLVTVVYGTLEERFWSKVDKSGDCWLWTGALNRGGYGNYTNTSPRRTQLAHRWSWELAHGRPIPGDAHVLHRCDNPPCVNPDHLFLGDPLINARDKMAKGRLRVGSQVGELNSGAILTPEDVRAIRSLIGTGPTQRAIAERFGVSEQAVCDIKHGRNWAHIA